MKKTVGISSVITNDSWSALQQLTAARVALGRAGASLPLRESLAFNLDHARARDAVYAPFQPEEVAALLLNAGLAAIVLASEATDRQEYLTRPDRGRLLSTRAREKLSEIRKGYDVCLVVGDGLSARAIHEQAGPFAITAADMLHRAGLSLGPVCLVSNARVAIGDEIGALLKARLVAVLIGERPGLSSPNSMGLYLTMNPAPGTTDERRNCISNIREGGLPLTEAIRKFGYLVEEALRLGRSGVELKDRMAPNYLPFGLSLPGC